MAYLAQKADPGLMEHSRQPRSGNYNEESSAALHKDTSGTQTRRSMRDWRWQMKDL